MSLEADLIEVRKLTKMFAGIANVEAALSGALGAEASNHLGYGFDLASSNILIPDRK